MNENALGEEGHGWQEGDWIFFRHGSPHVNWLNQQVTKIHQEVSERTGIYMSRTEQPTISEHVMVFNVALKECYHVLIHRVVSCGSISAPQGRLVKLSERRFAPYRARELRLATPAYYRQSEGVDTNIADPHDGLLTKDATPWMRQKLAPRGLGTFIHDHSASLTYSSAPDEPWVYCTSMSPESRREAKDLRARFPRYDALTVIKDPASFAMQLGIDFAISVDKSKHVELDPVDEEAYRRSRYTVSLWDGEHRIDKFVRVYHGPVVYEDQSGVLQSEDDLVDFSMAPKGWFTKRTRFSGEREYRFAVSTLGRPKTDTFKLGVSDELRLLTAKA